jgi:hypothetical protein
MPCTSPAFRKDHIKVSSTELLGPDRVPINIGIVETVYPRKRENPKGFLDAVVGDAKRQVENKRVEEVVASGNVEADLRKALEVR